MRLVVVALLAALASACVARRAAGPDTGVGERGSSHRAATAVASSREKTAAKPEVMADEGVTGKVVLVNPLLRFLVLDFPVRKLPVVDQRLNIYHNGQKIGEVKVTGPTRDTTIAGDIIAGEANVGDEARDD
jgi:hypothetical protein